MGVPADGFRCGKAGFFSPWPDLKPGPELIEVKVESGTVLRLSLRVAEELGFTDQIPEQDPDKELADKLPRPNP